MNAGKKHRSVAAKPDATPDETPQASRLRFLPPLKPSRRRFFVAAGLLAAWLGLLLILYVTAVFPEKQKKTVKRVEPQPAPNIVPR
ncbi:hypothetical protein [Humisphaera borealis]|uniref:Uncharacterized protein n=1 Tax=Humisphaera borealis TaxID=2807512 RepID=A0A7M2WSG3_9BACT|nr:hypothetical protein [Humisphaera borealis]QOV87530.1 hypothetical protein IPV69_14660 [Humisphaera borealis]